MTNKQIKNKKHQHNTALANTGSKSNHYIYTCTFVFLFGFGLYSNTIYHDYVYDDVSVILDNYLTQMGLAGIPDLFTKAYWYGFRGDNYGTYRPLSLITFALEHEFIGDYPHVSHFINVLLNGCVVLVLFIVLCRLFNLLNGYANKSKILLPFIITLFYAAHPVHTEVVANIKSRDEILCFLFFLISMLFLLDYLFDKKILEKNYKKIIYLFLTASFYYLSILSKETAVTFVAVVPLTLYFFTKLEWKRIFSISMVYLLVTGIYFLMRLNFLDSFAEGQNLAPIDNTIAASLNYSQRFATPVYILLLYIKLLIFPHPLIYDYSYKMISIVDWSDVKAIASLLAHGGLLFYSIKNITKKDKVVYGILFYLITISIVSNIVILIGSTMAERFLYAPSLGFCIILGILVYKLFKTKEEGGESILNSLKKNGLYVIPLLAIFILYSYKTFSRNKVWKDNYTLYSNDMENTSKSARANLFYGQELLDRAKVEKNEKQRTDYFDGAKKYMDVAGSIDPSYSDVWLNLGIAYVESGDNQEGIKNYQKVIQIDPKYDKAYYNMGNALFNLKQWEEAENAFRKAFEINPGYIKAFYNLGNVYLQTNRNTEAIEYYKKALKLDPQYVDVYNNMGNAFTNMNKFDEAIKVYQQAIQISPNVAMLYNNMGNAYNNIKKYDEAIQSFQMAIQLDPKYMSAYNNTGVAYFYKKNYDEAIKFFNRVLQMDPMDRGAYINIGFCYQQKGDKVKASEFFAKAKEVN